MKLKIVITFEDTNLTDLQTQIDNFLNQNFYFELFSAQFTYCAGEAKPYTAMLVIIGSSNKIP